MIIGEKIKELRKKNDLTQEKLADYLCVSYQAVSKWETGISSPDLSLIPPLTKLLHVSADELLGLNQEADTKRVELEEAYKKTWNTGDLDERYRIVETIVSAYPGEMKYLEWLANCEWCLALESKDDSKYRTGLEKALRHYETVIENTDDIEVKRSAISGIVMTLTFLQQKEEALKYANMYPDSETGLTRSDVLDWCLGGEELRKNRQERIDIRLQNFLGALLNISEPEYQKTICEIVKIMIPDGNYLYFHDYIFMSYINQAIALTKTGNYEDAIEMLRKAHNHAVEFDKMAIGAPGTHKYTAPMLNLVEINTNDFCRTGTGTKTDDYREWLDSKWFDPLREREDFKELIASF